MWEDVYGVPLYYYDSPSQIAFTNISNVALQLEDGLYILSIKSVSPSLISGSLRRQLSVNMSVAVEFFCTISAILEDSNYIDPHQYGLILQDRLLSAYTSSFIASWYTSLCVNYNAQYFTIDTEVLFTAPRFSEIQVEIVRTNWPTAVPAKENSNNANEIMSSVPYLYLYAIATGVFVCILFCAAIMVRNWYKSKRKLPIRDPQINFQEKKQEFDFDEVDFYTPTPGDPSDSKPASKTKRVDSNNLKYQHEQSSSGQTEIEMKTLESESLNESQRSPENDITKSKSARITVISRSGSAAGAPIKKKLTTNNKTVDSLP